ncbi:restriction endonuclease subunit S [Citrobacter amalonaticus]|uniref:restriction endonuclease subunit S n=1 Tax=Citrobacter amalonaticus TaxID=35703 RepID=UPI0022DEEC97|nr:restriction endonuclease subunit S [Citrobacter amalonaticus]
MDNFVSMPQYETYRNSNIQWIGEIPTKWGLEKAKWLFYKAERKPLVDDEIVTCFRDGQVTLRKNRRIEGFTNALKEHGYQRICKGDLVIHAMDAFAGAIGVSDSDGKSTPVYAACIPREKGRVNSYYYAYYMRDLALSGFIESLAKGIRERSTDFRFNNFAELLLPLPSYEEQSLIVSFLDKKKAQIDDAIAIKEQEISLLKERKQIIIQKAVMQGLDPNVSLKDSGVNWIGKIPEHWEVRRSKFLFTQRKERAWKDDVQLSATQAYGVIPQEQYEVLTGKRVVKIQFHLDKRKHVEKDDFVISMRSFQGGLERAWAQGCIRSSYVVLRPLEDIDAAFYGYLLKLPSYITALQQTASFIRDGQDLNFDNFSQVDLFIPPIHEQREIASYVSSFMASSDEGIELLLAQIEKLKEYKTTLINSAVTGKIRITPEMV